MENDQLLKIEGVFNSNFLFSGNKSDINSIHMLSLSQTVTEEITNGNSLSEDVFEFFILDFLTNCPLMKNKVNANSHFVILTDKFIKSVDRMPDDEKYTLLKNFNILEKSSILIVNITERGVWNLVIIENNSDNENKNNFNFTLHCIQFDKFTSDEEQEENLNEITNKFKRLLPFCQEEVLLATNSDIAIKTNFIKIKNFENKNDTGLVIGKIMMDIVSEENISLFLNSTNFEEYVNDRHCVNQRLVLSKKYSEILKQLKHSNTRVKEDVKNTQTPDDEEKEKLESTLNFHTGQNNDLNNDMDDFTNLNNISDIMNITSTTAVNDSFIKKGGIAQLAIDFTKTRPSVSQKVSENKLKNNANLINLIDNKARPSVSHSNSIAKKSLISNLKVDFEENNKLNETINFHDDLNSYKLYPDEPEPFSSKTYVKKRTTLSNPLALKKNNESLSKEVNSKNKEKNNLEDGFSSNRQVAVNQESIEEFSSRTYIPPKKIDMTTVENKSFLNAGKVKYYSKMPNENIQPSPVQYAKPLRLNKKEVIVISKDKVNNLNKREISYITESDDKSSQPQQDSFLTHQMKREFNKRGPKIRSQNKKTDINALLINFPTEEAPREQHEENCVSCEGKCLNS